ncbi:MAG: 30S ribosome-binding factor RbfA, partial [bacterium]|nr:30S ribosome-binding factor RbfA [bacterium]
MQFKRKNRVAVLVKDLLGNIIQKEYTGVLPGMVTIMNVELSDDLKYAKVFVSCYGSDDAKKRSMQILQRGIRQLRKRLGVALTLKHLPQLSFIEDNSLDKAFRIEHLLS